MIVLLVTCDVTGLRRSKKTTSCVTRNNDPFCDLASVKEGVFEQWSLLLYVIVHTCHKMPRKELWKYCHLIYYTEKYNLKPYDSAFSTFSPD